MRKPRNRFDRTTQILRWLLSEFNFSHKLSLRWVDEIEPDADSPGGYHGYVEEKGKKLEIVLCAKSNRSRSVAIETALHEAAHAFLWKEGLGLQHGPRYWQIFGEFRDAYDHHGYIDSAIQPFD